MRSSDFTSRSPGALVEASDARGERGLAFLPERLAPKLDFGSRELRIALSRADQELTRLDGMAGQIERPDLLFAGYLRNEAVLSSAIEGTHTTLTDLALFEVSRASTDADDLVVADYVHAFDYGRDRVAELRIGHRLFSELHHLLMRSTDARAFTPGQFRDCQVFVGSPTFAAARYVPPPEIYVRELVENLEDYLENDPEPALLKLAVAHYQFEAIHPFRDGNGRLGRLMISLFLERVGILKAPMLYLSAYFERNREEYYDRLYRVSSNGEWIEWMLFFLRGVEAQSRDASRRAANLLELRAEYRRRVAGKRIVQGVSRLIDRLFESPVLTVPIATRMLDVTAKPARNSIKQLIDAGILDPAPVRIGVTNYYVARELLHAIEAPLDRSFDGTAVE